MAPALPPTFLVAAPAGDFERLDWMLPTSAGSLVLGGAMMLGGAFTFASIDDDEYCGITGCVDRPHPLETSIGAKLVGAGLGMAVVGGFGMISWAANRPEGAETRYNEKVMSVGLGALSLAGASLGLTIAEAVTYERTNFNFATAFPYFITTNVLALVGIPMLAVGANIVTDAERGAERQREKDIASSDAPKEMYSPGMVIGGSILTMFGAFAGLAGTATVIGDLASNDTDDSGNVSLLIGVPLLGVGGLFSAIGVPLIAVGTKQVETAETSLADAPKEMYSRGMVTGGIAVTVIGGLAGVAGTATIIADFAGSGTYKGYASAVIGGPLMGLHALLSSIGIPLIVVGSRPTVKHAEKVIDFAPTVDIGPAGLRASWSLE